jgi:hypothetical protein
MHGQDHAPDETEAAQGSDAPVVPETRNANPAQPATADQLQEVEREMTGFERATLRWARVAVLMSGLAALFVCLQWYEMRKGGVDTHDLAVAAGKQASRMQDFADRMKDQADRTKDLVDQATIQTEASQQLTQNAIDTLRNTQQSFRDEQRAWVGLLGTNPEPFTETEPWTVTVVFFNSGRTPASNVKSAIMYKVSPVAISGPAPEDIKALKFHPVQSVAPQAAVNQIVGHFAPPEGMTQSQEEGVKQLLARNQAIKNGKLFLYYYGIVKYADNSGNPHETQFCIYLSDPAKNKVGICDAFNDLN